MLMLVTRSISWWYWLATVILLTAGMSGWSACFSFTIGLAAIQLIHFSLREHSLVAFPIQVRLAYLLLLLIALPENLQWIYWIPTIGTWTQVFPPQVPPAGLEPRLADLLDAVDAGADTVAALAATGRPVGTVLGGLSELELLGHVRRDLAGHYVRARP